MEQNGLISKELVFTSFDETIDTVHMGFFPPRGRYFRQEMTRQEGGYFRLEAELPAGKSFYHYFFNRNFDKPENHAQFVISQYDSLKRAPLVLETEPFCPLQFRNESNFISHVKDDIWEVRAITHQQWIGRVELVTANSTFPLSVVFRNKNLTYWAVRINSAMEQLRYCMMISGGGQVRYLHNDHVMKDHPCPGEFFVFRLDEKKDFDLAPSLQSGYQVLPDRFHRSGTGSTARGLKNWGEEPDHYSYFGGDLQGLREKLDYIAGLGVDFIYLNPVFLSGSYHRYDCWDYTAIDPLLGSGDDFKKLVQSAHELGIKIILDISLNHCGRGFFAFTDILICQERSPYKDWFEIRRFPVTGDSGDQYSSWHGYEELPQFNLANKDVEDYFMRVARYWPRNYDIDGWRLDVCTEMPPGFIEKFARESRKVKPGLVMIAENWQNNYPELSTTCRMDGVTNYSVYLDGIVPFFVQESISCGRLAEMVLRSQMHSTFRGNRFSWNFLSNHDLPRFYSILKNKRNYLPALVFMYSLPGIPVIYYGEEKGMEGLADPANRGCMQFGGQSENAGGGACENAGGDPCENAAFVSLLKRLNRVRAEHPDVFAYGALFFPLVDEKNKVLVVQRSLGAENLYFILNFGEEPYAYPVEAGGPLLVNAYDTAIIYVFGDRIDKTPGI